MQNSLNLQKKKSMSDSYKYIDPDYTYTDPKTGVLRNLANISEPDILLFAESGAVTKRTKELYENPIKIKDSSDLLTIHKHLFQDIYSWAGKLRTVNISKGGKPFFDGERFHIAFQYIDTLISEYRNIPKNNRKDLAKKLAEILDNINYLHPFREGNGRTQREFLRLLALEKGLKLNLNPPDNFDVYERYMSGTIDGDVEKLSNLIFELTDSQSAIGNQQSAENLEAKSQKPKAKSRIIGLTGGIGSGKTTVAKIIEEMGFPVYYSDDEAKNIVNKDSVLKEKVKELLGENAYDENGFYNRKYVSEKVFNNDELLEKLNQLIHPSVKQDFENWVNSQNSTFLFKETALLFELKLNEQCYKSVLVTAEDKIRMKRVMDRDGKTYREVEKIMEKQMPEKEKLKLADFIIYNNTNLEGLKAETEKIIGEITLVS